MSIHSSPKPFKLYSQVPLKRWSCSPRVQRVNSKQYMSLCIIIILLVTGTRYHIYFQLDRRSRYPEDFLHGDFSKSQIRLLSCKGNHPQLVSCSHFRSLSCNDIWFTGPFSCVLRHPLTPRAILCYCLGTNQFIRHRCPLLSLARGISGISGLQNVHEVRETNNGHRSDVALTMAWYGSY